MTDVEKRVELACLMDFYGPLLTENRRELLRLYCDEDLSLQEIAEQTGITRQGVYDAVRNAREQLLRYEETLSLAARYRAIRREVALCREALSRVSALGDSAEALARAKEALDRIEWIER